nr:uncharacterized protein LOC111517630 [Leptinotarsa decemlineata]
MERNLEIINWLRKMGYDGEIPETLGNLSNNSTSFIWDQLLENAKPRQQVADIRNNILIHRLNSKPLDKQGDFTFPVKEIDLYLKKSSLEDKSKTKQFLLDEKKTLDHDLYQKIKLKCITMEKLKAKIKENEEREFLLQKKLMLLEKDVQQAEDMLNFLGNLTPVELDVKPNTIEITQTLEECAEKLEELLHKYPIPTKKLANHEASKACYSSQKSTAYPSVLEKYLTLTEKKTSKHLISARKVFPSHNKENIALNKVTKCLFAEEEEPKRNKPQEIRSNPRESLGLLPDSCFGDYFMMGDLVSSENPFSPSLQTLQRVDLNSPLLMNRTRNDFKGKEQDLKKEFLDRLYGSEVVTERLSELIHKNNRSIVWNTFQSLDDNLHLDIGKYLVLESSKKANHKGIDSDDISKLQFLHVQTELQILKHNAISKHLAQNIEKKKANVYVSITSKGFSVDKTEDIKRSFEQHFEDASLEATLSAMKREIGNAKNAKDKIDLQLVSRKLSQTKENIGLKISSIQEFIDLIGDILTSIDHTRDTAIACVRKLIPFIGDMEWSTTLKENVCSGEIRTFENFPLEFNRRCIHTESTSPIYYRDLCTDNLAADLEIDDGNLCMLTEILESPFSFPETIVLNILRAKLKLDVLKSTKYPSKSASFKRYSFEELHHQESYINFALDRFNSLIHSSSSEKTLSSAEVAKKVMDLWLEMPFKDFIPSTRMVEEKNYTFYENKFDSFYNNL